MTTNNIGPHGVGCKCTPGDGSTTTTAVYRGDLSTPDVSAYQFKIGTEQKRGLDFEAPAAIDIIVKLDRKHPDAKAALGFMEKNFSDFFAEALFTHAVKADPVGAMMAMFMSDLLGRGNDDRSN